MKIVVKLYGLLRRNRPEDAPGKAHHSFEMKVDDGTLIGDIISQLGIEEGMVAGMAVNGEAVHEDALLNDGDEIGLFPPVAGG